MAKHCLLSILVPVYQVEAYLRTCVESLLRQHVDKEIILVDDGSTDGSGTICDAYAAQYEFIHVVHKPNGGLVSARLAGLAAAQGRYIAFADSDDWVDEDYYQPMVEAMEQDALLDICIGRTVCNYPDGGVKEYGEPMPDQVMFRQEAAREMILGTHYHWELWGKVYRRTLFVDFHPDPMFVCGEDLVQNWQLFARARRVRYMARQGAYQYRYNFDSITHTVAQQVTYQKALAYVRHHMWMNDAEIQVKVEQWWLSSSQTYFRELAFCRFEGGGCITEMRHAYAQLHQTLSTTELASLEERMLLFQGTYDSCLARYQAVFADMAEKIQAGLQAGVPFFVYGTGVAGDYAARLLSRFNGVCAGFLVSPGELKRTAFYGHPVAYATAERLSQPCIVFLAMSERGQQAVRQQWTLSRAKWLMPDMEQVF